MSKVIPAYQQIKEAILDNIHSGLWQAGQAIPPELTLAEQFGVSRMTVNRALKELSEANSAGISPSRLLSPNNKERTHPEAGSRLTPNQVVMG